MQHTLTPRRRMVTFTALLAIVASACGDSGQALQDVTPTASAVTTTTTAAPNGTDETSVSTSATADPDVTDPDATNPGTTSADSTSETGPSTPISVAADASWANATDGLVGLDSECGNLSLVAARADSDVVIASVALRGLWSSAAAGAPWTQLGTGPGSDVITNRATSFTFDPDHPDTFWESGMYDGAGAYRTDDGGTTFTQLGDLFHLEAVAVDLSDPQRQTLLATGHESQLIHSSADGGSSWLDISSSLPQGIGFATGPVVIDSSTFLLGTSKTPQMEGAGIFRSTDGGATWTLVFEFGVVGRPIRDSEGAMFWLLDNGGGIVTSSDDGATWQVATPQNVLSPAAPSIQFMEDGSLASISRNNTVIVSSDGGATWAAVGPPMPYVPTGFAYAPRRRTFYAWRFDCEMTPGGTNPIKPDSIVRLDLGDRSTS